MLYHKAQRASVVAGRLFHYLLLAGLLDTLGTSGLFVGGQERGRAIYVSGETYRERERDMKMVGARSKGEKGMACELTRGPLPAALAASSAFCFSSIFSSR